MSNRTHRSVLIFFFQNEIFKIAKTLRLNAEAGYDKIPIWFVKESIIYISDPLRYV